MNSTDGGGSGTATGMLGGGSALGGGGNPYGGGGGQQKRKGQSNDPECRLDYVVSDSLYFDNNIHSV